jgi:hypothetical protein
MLCTVMEELKGLKAQELSKNAQLLVTVYCQLQRPLVFEFCDVNPQCQVLSELYVEPQWYGEKPNVIARLLDFLLNTSLKICSKI